ncbi:MAG: family 20 glycosylhydrolase, partial [Mangrovibacterium sp.]
HDHKDVTKEAAERGNNVISCLRNRMYFDRYISHERGRIEPLAFPQVTELHKVYNFDPVPEDLDAQYHNRVIGVQGNLWTEYVPTNEVAEYRTFPRMAMLAEVAWTNQELRNWENMNRKLPYMFEIYDRWGLHYNRVYISTGSN